MRNLLIKSTDDAAPELRIRYWRDAVHEAVVEMDLLPSMRSDFHGHIELCPLTHVVPHQAKGSPQKISRDPFDIARGTKNAYYLISQSRLPWRCIHAGEDHWVQPGESVLVDSRVPYACTFDQGFDDLSLELPIYWVERWLAEPDRVIGKPLSAASGWGLALRGAKEALVPRKLASLALPDELIEDQLGALLALAVDGAQTCTRQPPGDELFERCLSAIRGRLFKPGLVASDIAQECKVSLRTVHRTFALNNSTFAGVLMQMRVEEAKRMMADRRFSRLAIAEIGRRCGFLDPSHFSRQFKRLQNICPRQFRDALTG